MLGPRHRHVRDADVFLASYPKSGNTWLRHLLTFIVTGEPTPWRGGLDRVSHLIGRHQTLPTIARNGGRLIKTHEPYRDTYRRAVLMVRDARDVAVSEFHYQQAYSDHFHIYGGSFEVFLRRFLAGRCNGYRSWHDHVLSWHAASRDQRCDTLTIRFEDFKADTFGNLRKIVDHIGVVADDERLQNAIDDCSVESMKRKEREFWESKGQPNRNFVRGGKTGGWKQRFTPELEAEFWSVAGTAMTTMGYQRIPVENAT